MTPLKLLIVLLFILITGELWASVSPGQQTDLIRVDRTLTNQEMQQISDSSFKQFTRDVAALFPRESSRQPGPVREIVSINPQLLAAGKAMRELKRLTFRHPQNLQESMDFLKECSRSEEYISTINALCLGHALDLAQTFRIPFDLTGYPKTQIELAQLTLPQ